VLRNGLYRLTIVHDLVDLRRHSKKVDEGSSCGESSISYGNAAKGGFCEGNLGDDLNTNSLDEPKVMKLLFVETQFEIE